MFHAVLYPVWQASPLCSQAIIGTTVPPPTCKLACPSSQARPRLKLPPRSHSWTPCIEAVRARDDATFNKWTEHPSHGAARSLLSNFSQCESLALNRLMSHTSDISQACTPPDVSKLKSLKSSLQDSINLKRTIAVSTLGTVDNTRLFPFAETGLHFSASLPNITLYLSFLHNTRITPNATGCT
jgi:hypothetical protein